MAYYTNQLITDYIVSTAGRTFPTNASRTPAGATFVPTIAAVSVGSDTYRVTFTPTTTGAWLFDVTDSVGERWSATYQVDAVQGAAVVGSALDPTDLGLTLFQGDDVLPGWVWTLDGAPNLATGTLALLIGRNGGGLVATLTGTAAGVWPGTQTVTVPAPRATTALLGAKAFIYQLTHTAATTGNVTTLAAGALTATPRIA